MKVLVVICIIAYITVSSAVERDTIVLLERIEVKAGRVEPLSVAPQSVERLLSENPAITFIKRGPSAADPIVRGASGNDILVTLDGARVQTACTDRMDPLTSYMGDNFLSGIEVKAGGCGLEAGAPPLGKVNLLLKRAHPGASQLKWNIGGQVSSTDTALSGQGSVAWKSPRIAVDLTASTKRIEDYHTPDGNTIFYSGLHAANLFATSTIQASTETRLRTTLLGDRFWNAGYPALPMDVGFSELLHGAVGIDHIRHNGSIFSALLYANRTAHAMDDTHRRNNAMHMDMPGAGSTYGGWGVFRTPAGSHNFSLRIEGWHADQSASMTMYDDHNTPSMYLETWPLTSTVGFAGSFADEIRITDQWNVHSAISAESNSISMKSDLGKRQVAMLQPAASVKRSFVSPGVVAGIQFKPSQNNEIGLSVSGSRRAPAMDELYGFYLFNAATNRDYLGNARLSPEKIYQAELNGKFIANIFKASWAIWSTRKDEVIEAVDAPDISPMTAGAYGTRQWSNRGREWRTGIESDIRIKPCAFLEFISIARYIYGKALLSCHVPQVPTTGGTTTAVFQVSWINIATELEWAPTQNRLDPMFSVVKSPGYAVPHLRLSGQIPGPVQLHWRAGIENILNLQWCGNQDWNNVTTKRPLYRPGRNFYFGLSVQS